MGTDRMGWALTQTFQRTATPSRSACTGQPPPSNNASRRRSGQKVTIYGFQVTESGLLPAGPEDTQRDGTGEGGGKEGGSDHGRWSDRESQEKTECLDGRWRI